MFYFKRWGRLLFAGVVVCGYVLDASCGATVSSATSNVFSSLSDVLSGAVLGLAYLLPTSSSRRIPSHSYATSSVQSVVKPATNKGFALFVGAALIGGLVVFVAVIWLGVNLFHSPPTDRASITEVLQQDAQLGKEYSSQVNALKAQNPSPDAFCDQRALLTRELVISMRNIDISRCPTDFKEAYIRHTQCWSDVADAYYSHPHLTGDLEGTLGELLIAGIGGNASDEVDFMSNIAQTNESFLEDLKERHSAITSSFDEVQNVAVKYGVKPVDYSE